MKIRFIHGLLYGVWLGMACLHASGQKPLEWSEVRDRFEAANPALRADQLEVDEARAAELTAFLRPNPQFTFGEDGTQIAPYKGVWQPTSATQLQSMLSYLHEREGKRELRHESARQATSIATAQHEDLRRSLEFNLRALFIQVLEDKQILKLAEADLADFDKIIDVSRERLRAGDLAQIDLDRIELARVQFEQEIESARVNLRTAKIQLEQLLNERTPVEQFDVAGVFDVASGLKTLDEYRQIAQDSRPDLRAAMEAVEQAQTNHKLAEANGSADPTISAWHTFNPSFNNPFDKNTLGLSVSVPLRIFDRNQGEKQRTAIDIDRNRQLTEAARAQVFADVDSAYAQLESAARLLKPYKEKYNAQAAHVRDTVTYSWQHGGASLLDFLSAEGEYRQVRLAYVNLIGSSMTAASQLNLAVGREVLP